MSTPSPAVMMWTSDEHGMNGPGPAASGRELLLGGGLTGGFGGLCLQLYTNGILLPFSLFDWTVIAPFLPSGYPYPISGKPLFSVWVCRLLIMTGVFL